MPNEFERTEQVSEVPESEVTYLDTLKQNAKEGLDWLGNKFKSGVKAANKSYEENPEYWKAGLGMIDDLGKRAQIDKLKAADLAYSPFSGNKILSKGKSDVGGAGDFNPLAEFTDAEVIKKKRLERDRIQKLLENSYLDKKKV